LEFGCVPIIDFIILPDSNGGFNGVCGAVRDPNCVEAHPSYQGGIK